MKKLLVCMVLGLTTLTVNASVIDIVEQADGTFNVFSDGNIYGSGMSRAAAEKVAGKLGGANTINWKWFTKATPTPGATAANFNPSKALPGGTAPKALPAHPGASPTPTSQQALPAGSSPKALPAHQEPTPKPTPKGSSTLSKVGGVLGAASGAYMIYDSYGEGDTKATWTDVAEGAAGGLIATQSLIALNAIPVAGNITYAAAVAVGTVVGASLAGGKMFAETDCDYDPVRQAYACCNVSKLTNLEGFYANIGDKMFADFPYVRTCLQGGKTYESNWFKARFLDDEWSEGQEVFCNGWDRPTTSDPDMKVNIIADTNNMCWKWECADTGYIRSGSKCVLGNGGAAQPASSSPSSSSNSNGIVDGGQIEPVVVTAGIKAGDACPSDRLPQYATAGVYIKNGKNPDTGLDKFVCAATACKDGTYLVRNERGESQGWCRVGVAPVVPGTSGAGNGAAGGTNGTDGANGANGENSDSGAPGSNVPVQSPVMPGLPESPVQPPVYQTPCEQGMTGYIMYNGKCITNDEYENIQRALIQSQQSKSQREIKEAAAGISNLAASFKRTVWKNEDGKFNTTRLASDLTAAVVLGTTGGLVTSSVIKKNQVKKGFENIRCVIGGQAVADWGDQFKVGVK